MRVYGRPQAGGRPDKRLNVRERPLELVCWRTLSRMNIHLSKPVSILFYIIISFRNANIICRMQIFGVFAHNFIDKLINRYDYCRCVARYLYVCVFFCAIISDPIYWRTNYVRCAQANQKSTKNSKKFCRAKAKISKFYHFIQFRMVLFPSASASNRRWSPILWTNTARKTRTYFMRNDIRLQCVSYRISLDVTVSQLMRPKR